jgi:hypothetical protein
MRNKVLIWAAVLVAVFLVGFLPSYLRSRGMEAELRQTSQRLEQSRLLNLIGLAYFQAAQKNYGMASETSTAFFNRLREVADQLGSEPERQKALQEILASRDKIISGLAQGDPAVLNEIQSVFTKTQSAIPG